MQKDKNKEDKDDNTSDNSGNSGNSSSSGAVEKGMELTDFSVDKTILDKTDNSKKKKKEKKEKKEEKKEKDISVSAAGGEKINENNESIGSKKRRSIVVVTVPKTNENENVGYLSWLEPYVENNYFNIFTDVVLLILGFNFVLGQNPKTILNVQVCLCCSEV